MKVVTDPILLKQLNNDEKSSNIENNMSISHITSHPLFRFLVGAGGGIQNSLANLPYSPIPSAPEAQGLSGQLGDVTGNILSFLGGGEALNTARAASESLPLIGRLAKTLSGEGSAGIARRIAGTALGGALESPDNRLQGAEKGALFSGLGESIPVALKSVNHIAEFMSPQRFTNQLAASIKHNYQQSKIQAKDLYDKVLSNIGDQTLSTTSYNQLTKGFFKYYDAKLNQLHQEFIQQPTFDKAHQLQSQIGSKIAQLQSKKDPDVLTHNAILDLKQARSILQNDIAHFLQQKYPAVSDRYQAASQFYKNTVIPYKGNSLIRKIVQGERKAIKPEKLAESLTNLLQSDKTAISPTHYLKEASNQISTKIHRGKMTSQLAALLTGAGLGEITYPGGLGAFGGLIGGSAAHRYVLPKLLDLAVNPYANQQIKKLNAPYQFLLKSLIANQLPQENNYSSE
jgi:hypothetical protein